MAKRGRPRLNPREKQGAYVGIRINEMLLRRLEDQARANGRTRSQEIVARLAESLDNRRPRHDELGGDVTYNFFRLLTVVLNQLHQQTGHAWHENAYTFEQAKNAFDVVMHAFRPSGPSWEFPDDHPDLAELEKAQAAKWIAARKKFNGKAIGFLALYMLERGDKRDNDFARKLELIRAALIGKVKRTGKLAWVHRNLEKWRPYLKLDD